MATTVGEAIIELRADSSHLGSDMSDATRQIERRGAAAGAAYAGSMSRATARMAGRLASVAQMALTPMVAGYTMALKKLYQSTTVGGREFRKQWLNMTEGVDKGLVNAGMKLSRTPIFGKTPVGWGNALGKFLQGLDSAKVERFVMVLQNLIRAMVVLKGLTIAGNLFWSMQRLSSQLGQGGGRGVGDGGAAPGSHGGMPPVFPWMSRGGRGGLITPKKQVEASEWARNVTAQFGGAALSREYMGRSRTLAARRGVFEAANYEILRPQLVSPMVRKAASRRLAFENISDMMPITENRLIGELGSKGSPTNRPSYVAGLKRAYLGLQMPSGFQEAAMPMFPGPASETPRVQPGPKIKSRGMVAKTIVATAITDIVSEGIELFATGRSSGLGAQLGIGFARLFSKGLTRAVEESERAVEASQKRLDELKKGRAKGLTEDEALRLAGADSLSRGDRDTLAVYSQQASLNSRISHAQRSLTMARQDRIREEGSESQMTLGMERDKERGDIRYGWQEEDRELQMERFLRPGPVSLSKGAESLWETVMTGQEAARRRQETITDMTTTSTRAGVERKWEIQDRNREFIAAATETERSRQRWQEDERELVRILRLAMIDTAAAQKE